jgi:hypothetical protein
MSTTALAAALMMLYAAERIRLQGCAGKNHFQIEHVTERRDDVLWAGR